MARELSGWDPRNIDDAGDNIVSPHRGGGGGGFGNRPARKKWLKLPTGASKIIRVLEPLEEVETSSSDPFPLFYDHFDPGQNEVKDPIICSQYGLARYVDPQGRCCSCVTLSKKSTARYGIPVVDLTRLHRHGDDDKATWSECTGEQCEDCQNGNPYIYGGGKLWGLAKGFYYNTKRKPEYTLWGVQQILKQLCRCCGEMLIPVSFNCRQCGALLFNPSSAKGNRQMLIAKYQMAPVKCETCQFEGMALSEIDCRCGNPIPGSIFDVNLTVTHFEDADGHIISFEPSEFCDPPADLDPKHLTPIHPDQMLKPLSLPGQAKLLRLKSNPFDQPLKSY